MSRLYAATLGKILADKKRRRIAAAVFAPLLVAAILLSCFASLLPAKTAGPPAGPFGDVIQNYPYNQDSPIPSVEDVVWDSVIHSFYDRAYTDSSNPVPGSSGQYTADEKLSHDCATGTSGYYNGLYGNGPTPDHLVLNGDDINFFGYGIEPHMDYVFSEGYYEKTYGNAFILRPLMMNFHSFSETGYLFNGTMTTGAGGYKYYTGYALVLKCANEAGMQENDSASPNTAALCLYYINNERLDTESFRPGNTGAAGTRTLITVVKNNIQNWDTTPFRTSVEIDPDTRAFKVYVDDVLRADVAAGAVQGGPTGPTGFGFYTGYYEHNCGILTRIRYEDVAVNVLRSNEPASATVFLVDDDGNTIRNPETETGYVTQRYRITQPLEVEYDGETYYLIENDRGLPIFGDIQLRYWLDSAENETTLIYTKDGTKVYGNPQKDARVDGGDWDRGTSTSPVPVTVGSEIEYNLSVYNLKEGTPMMMVGSPDNSASTTIYHQTTDNVPGSSLIPKEQVKRIYFVNLPMTGFSNAAITPAQFLSQYPTGQTTTLPPKTTKEILNVWDATDNTATNPDRNTHKVLCWTTESDESGMYDLFIGGVRGVWMTSNPYSTLLFREFTKTETIDFEDFHTEKAVNMNGMFTSAASLKNLDLSGFDTSNVKDMGDMFYQSASPGRLTTLDLSSFDTRKVENMDYMFYGQQQLTSLDLRNFYTPNLITMYGMFLDCRALSSVDVSNMDTLYIEYMDLLFSDDAALENINISLDPINKTPNLWNFSTSNVGSMASMFSGCSKLASLNLNNFNTNNVTNINFMFLNCGLLEHIWMEGADFTVNNPSTVSTVSGLAANATTYVSTPAMKTWMENLMTGTRTVVNTSGSSNWEDYYIPPNSVPGNEWWNFWNPPPPPPEAPFLTVTDTIPDHLSLVPGSVTGVNRAPLPADETNKIISYQVSGQTITWNVPTSCLPAYLNFKVTVDSTAPTANSTASNLVNKATVAKGDTTQDTNSTYHRRHEGFTVREQYYLVDSANAIVDKLDDDLYTTVDPGDDYSVSASKLGALFGYQYVGYEIVPNGGAQTGAITPGQPPAPAFTNIQENKHIILYYKQVPAVKVTIHYCEQNGNEIAPPFVDSVAYGSGYWLANRHYDPITVGGITWSYYDFHGNPSGTNPGAVDNQAPVANPRGAPSAAPVYPPATGPDNPTFANVTADKHITLYFSMDVKAVVVRFREKGNEAHVLHPDMTFFVVSANFDPAVLRGDGQALTADIVSDANDKTYWYSNEYHVGSTTYTSSAIGTNHAAPCTITILFQTEFEVTEHYHLPNGDHVPGGPADVTTGNLPGGFSFRPVGNTGGTPPATIGDYKYMGCKIGNDRNLMIPGLPPDPILQNYFSDEEIIYVYYVPEKNAYLFDPDEGEFSGTPSNGTSLAPVPVEVGDNILYEITAANWKTSTLGTIVTDVLNPNLGAPTYISHNGTYDPGTRTITWNLSEYEDELIIVSFKAAATGIGVIENHAHLKYSDPGFGEADTNSTWHTTQRLTLTVSKTADPPSGPDEDNPAPVPYGSDIEYTIAVEVSGGASEPDMKPMIMHGGNNEGPASPIYTLVGGYTWETDNILSVEFINLPDNFDWDGIESYLSTDPRWQGKTIHHHNIYTENDSCNPDPTAIVWGWSIESATSPGLYDVYLGGKNGVWLSAYESDYDTASNSGECNSLFRFSSNMQSIDLTHLHTEMADNMTFMFDGCSSLTSLDLSGFDTSNVVSMEGMFAFCKALTTLDLSGFSTQSLTTITHMFRGTNASVYFNGASADFDLLTEYFEAFYGYDDTSGGLPPLYFPSSATLYVKDDAVKTKCETWFEDNPPDSIVVQPASGSPATGGFATGPATIVDPVPDGLVISVNSITPAGTPGAGTITWELDDDVTAEYDEAAHTITWTLPHGLREGVNLFKFTAKVNALQVLFENQAIVTVDGMDPEPTNKTWHIAEPILPEVGGPGTRILFTVGTIMVALLSMSFTWTFIYRSYKRRRWFNRLE